MSNDVDEIVKIFIIESNESLDKFESDIIELEKQPDSKELLTSMFRSIHSIKGTCGFLGFTKLESIAHAGENLLSKLRDGEVTINTDMAQAFFELCDTIRDILNEIESSGGESETQYSELTNKLKGFIGNKASSLNEKQHEDVKANGNLFSKDIAASRTVSTNGKERIQASINPMFSAQSSTDPEIIKIFLEESHQNLNNLSQDINSLEKDPKSKKIKTSIILKLDTMKGTAYYLGYSKFGSLLDLGQKIIEKLLDGTLNFTSEISHYILEMINIIRVCIQNIENTGNEGDVDDSGLLDGIMEKINSSISSGTNVVDTTAREQTKVEKKAIPHELPELKIQEEKVIPTVKKDDKISHSITDTVIRVDVKVLDSLMNLVGELVLTRNRILQHSSNSLDSAYTSIVQQLNLITSKLQENIMRTRMQPISNVYNILPKMIRDLSIKCGKKVNLVLEGKETELDKTILEAIKDPITHIVRNTIDHGIETPEKRVKVGKNETGILHMNSYTEGGQVIIEVSDDGAGINTEKVKAKVLEKELLPEAILNTMDDRDIVRLIFLPGFSTAEKVTNVSGRGVGMDVVKNNIEKIGGSVDLNNRPGRGITFTIKIPLTLAIIPALIVSCGKEYFAIPQISLVELLRLENNKFHSQIETVHETPVYRLRGQLLPLLFLNNELKLNTKDSNYDPYHVDVINIVIVKIENKQLGLVVDEIHDTQEIVVKPLSKQFKKLSIYTGATILGDGTIAIILNVLAIAYRGGMMAKFQDNKFIKEDINSQKINRFNQTERWLVFKIGNDYRMAVSLKDVTRLEEFQFSQLEKSGQFEVIQYRDRIMPLIRVEDYVSAHPSTSTKEKENLHTIIYMMEKEKVGFIVDEFIDIVQEDVTIQKTKDIRGIVGSAVIQSKVTDILDIKNIIKNSNVKSFEFTDIDVKEAVEAEH
ncbi:MAG: chemotaxis protein CheA [Leptospiraceae bacterium]|nr:chemotaxis protein CheA [Leptospiraceae bacterium]